MLGASWLCFRVGVANNEDAGTGVGSPNVSRVNPKGARSITKHVQILPHRRQPVLRCVVRDVLDDDVLRSDAFDDFRERFPEREIERAPSTTRCRERLAREAAADEIDTRNLHLEHVVDVFVTRGVGPVLREHETAKMVELALPGDVAEASKLQTVFETAYSGEE